ncbi:beta-L-arabinofuranosidase domain-containing protein [Marinimicrobium koreense]|uniref:beta-L-arabinofuranosidase domain-containing protein n=1 Tax=Marinimicrobium koreense TaxID=306545 RepID=UPI003F6F7D42
MRTVKSRRDFLRFAVKGTLASASSMSLYACSTNQNRAIPDQDKLVGGYVPIPLASVELTSSIYRDALMANQQYMKSLSMDRLLSRFRKNAGLDPRAEHYEGWEADALAGHTLGHYLSAAAMTWSQTRDSILETNIQYVLDELEQCQNAHGDGYVGALGRWKDGDFEVNGKPLFSEIKDGIIDPKYGTLNGGWAPFYVLDKQLAGLVACYEYLGSNQALRIATGLATYIEGVFLPLSDSQVQRVLDCEFGGLQASVVDLYLVTGDQRWMKLARRIRHNAVIQPLVDGKDVLDDHHANTEVPKLVSAALIGRVDDDECEAKAGRNAWRSITADRSYANGGNGDQEWFRAKERLSDYITDQNCEHCSTYNMLKLTRELFSGERLAEYFDYYEKAHLNHVMAAQNPKTGMFAYMTPMMSGAKRSWSHPTEDFWCCVGTGLESHAKHSDSIYWVNPKDPTSIMVNLFIPSRLRWPSVGDLELSTSYPYEGVVRFGFNDIDMPKPVRLAVRKPGWCDSVKASFRGMPVDLVVEDGYLQFEQSVSNGDELIISFPMSIRSEQIADGGNYYAYFYGPTLLAADMGRDGEPLLEHQWPAMISDDGHVKFSTSGKGEFVTDSLTEVLTFRPYFAQFENRTAVYFPVYTHSQWKNEDNRRKAAQNDIETRLRNSLDIVVVGKEGSEMEHGFEEDRTEITPYRGRHGRRIKPNGFATYRMVVKPQPLSVFVTFWGEATRGYVDILVEGEVISSQRLEGERPGSFFEGEYSIPSYLIKGKEQVSVTIETRPETRAPSVYGLRIAPPSARS